MLKKITSHNSAHEFYYWLQDNPSVTHIQGFKLLRRDNNLVYGLKYGSNEMDYHYFDIDYIWKGRKMINDWINRYNI